MIEYFSGFFQEGQYFIELWTAHLILEYGKPSGQLEEKSIEIIQKYAQDSLDSDVILEERNWIELHCLNNQLIPFVSTAGNRTIKELSAKRSFKDWAMALIKLLRKEKIILFADFNNQDIHGRIRFTSGSFADAKRLNLELKQGLKVILDNYEGMSIERVVEFSKDENVWVARYNHENLMDTSIV
jgi:hypothetical protein